MSCGCIEGDVEGDVVLDMDRKGPVMCSTAIPYLCHIALYGGFMAVIVSVVLFTQPTDISKAPLI